MSTLRPPPRNSRTRPMTRRSPAGSAGAHRARRDSYRPRRSSRSDHGLRQLEVAEIEPATRAGACFSRSRSADRLSSLFSALDADRDDLVPALGRQAERRLKIRGLAERSHVRIPAVAGPHREIAVAGVAQYALADAVVFRPQEIFSAGTSGSGKTIAASASSSSFSWMNGTGRQDGGRRRRDFDVIDAQLGRERDPQHASPEPAGERHNRRPADLVVRGDRRVDLVKLGHGDRPGHRRPARSEDPSRGGPGTRCRLRWRSEHKALMSRHRRRYRTDAWRRRRGDRPRGSRGDLLAVNERKEQRRALAGSRPPGAAGCGNSW
ncbi:MAG: hypothetical protein MZV63_14380 [Marinilabiliales bacterium]|nr:hypothetical protein [Marinilabiliales bacterium]